jgi:hypothetical protein
MPLLWLSLAFLAGILFAAKVKLSLFTWLILAGAALILFLLFRILHTRLHISIKPLLLFSPALLGFFFLGAARYQSSLPRVDANYIAWYNDRDYELIITGSLTDPPDVRDTYTNLRLNVTAVDAGDQPLPVHGLMLARVLPGADWHYGDVVRLRGHLQTPPENEDFSYQDYLARQGILSYMPDAAATLLPSPLATPSFAWFTPSKTKPSHMFTVSFQSRKHPCWRASCSETITACLPRCSRRTRTPGQPISLPFPDLISPLLPECSSFSSAVCSDAAGGLSRP